MDILDRFTRLRVLLADPEANLGAIVSLLSDDDLVPETEVLRAVASQALAPVLRRRLSHPDPAARLAALESIERCLSRTAAASLLRIAAIDPSRRVRRQCAWVVRLLLLQGNHPYQGLGGFQGRRRAQPRAGAASPTALALHRVDAHSLLEARGALRPGESRDDAIRRMLRPGSGPGAPYVSFTVPKASGGEREICAPRAPLKAIQRALLAELAKLPTHPACHGFVKGRSTLSNAREHVGARVLVKVDIADFFPSIHFHRVAGLLRALGSRDATYARLMTYRPRLDGGKAAWPGVLPQGAPTSPVLANLICHRLDARLTGLARKTGAVYTRYADDLTFSFRSEPALALGRFFWWVNVILQQEGFFENAKKRRVFRSHQQQQVTGIVVNQEPHLPRKDRRIFRAILENCRRHGVASQARGRPDFEAYLLGYAAYAKMVQPELGQRWLDEVRRLLGKDSAG